MNQPHHVAQSLQPNLEYGKVSSGLSNGRLQVVLSFGTVAAQKAASCLLEPMDHDLVLVSVDLKGDCYILSILERAAENGCSTITVPGNCVIESSSGSIEIRAVAGLVLSAADDIEASGNVVRIHANKAEICITKMSVLGKVLHTQIKRITTVAKSVEQSLKRLTQRMESSERFVAEHEEIQSGSTRYLVEDTFTTHAGNTLNISEELHTMHAEQIHMS